MQCAARSAFHAVSYCDSISRLVFDSDFLRGLIVTAVRVRVMDRVKVTVKVRVQVRVESIFEKHVVKVGVRRIFIGSGKQNAFSNSLDEETVKEGEGSARRKVIVSRRRHG